MASEQTEMKDEQLPPQEAGGDDEVRVGSDAPKQNPPLRRRPSSPPPLRTQKIARASANMLSFPAGGNRRDEATGGRDGIRGCQVARDATNARPAVGEPGRK